MRRRNLVTIVVAAVLVSSLATWLAASQIRSPAEVAARTAPPTPTPILVPVEEKVLSTRVVTRGTAHFGSPRRLVLTPSLLKSGSQVVTGLPRPGSTLRSGDVIATVSGRPVFLLEGGLPSYRDLGPGMAGRDVAQLERALRRTGLDTGRADGVFDTATEKALAALYRRNRFAPFVASAAGLERVRPDESTMVEGAAAHAGVQLPSDEVVFVPATPLRVAGLPSAVGSPLDGVLVTVTDSDVVIDGLLPVEQAGRVHEGDRVVVDEPTLGIDTTGRVLSVAGRPGTNGADGFHVSFQVAVTRPPAALVGSSVRLTIPIRSTRTPQLTVPVTAVSLGPDGGSRVEKSVGGEVEFVSVRTGLSADGFVTVRPTKGELSAGDLVVVGFRGGR